MRGFGPVNLGIDVHLATSLQNASEKEAPGHTSAGVSLAIGKPWSKHIWHLGLNITA